MTMPDHIKEEAAELLAAYEGGDDLNRIRIILQQISKNPNGANAWVSLVEFLTLIFAKAVSPLSEQELAEKLSEFDLALIAVLYEFFSVTSQVDMQKISPEMYAEMVKDSIVSRGLVINEKKALQ